MTWQMLRISLHGDWFINLTKKPPGEFFSSVTDKPLRAKDVFAWGLPEGGQRSWLGSSVSLTSLWQDFVFFFFLTNGASSWWKQRKLSLLYIFWARKYLCKKFIGVSRSLKLRIFYLKKVRWLKLTLLQQQVVFCLNWRLIIISASYYEIKNDKKWTLLRFQKRYGNMTYWEKEHSGCLSNTVFIQFFSRFIATSRVFYCW